MTQMMRANDIKNLLKRLRLDQTNSDNEKQFEQDIAEAFRVLGFEAEAKGGPDDCDVLIFHGHDTAIVDAKTTKSKVIGEGFVNFEALDRYKEAYKAQDLAIVAKGFAKGNIRKTSEKKKVILIETEALCKVLENQAIYPYDLDRLFENLFRRRIFMTANDIDKSTIPDERRINILRDFFNVMDNPEISQVTTTELCIHFRFLRKNLTEDEIRGALELLYQPPFNIVHKDQDTYRLQLTINEMKKQLGILFSVMRLTEGGGPILIGPELPQRNVTAGDFEHVGGGIYVLKDNRQLKIDANKSAREVENELLKNNLNTRNIASFYYSLRKKGGLIK